MPNVALARTAGLHVNRGIRVNDTLQTSDPAIYAVGECAGHRGLVYGIVAPGLEQAAVAAHTVTGGNVIYAGSTLTTRLKILDLPVFSMGLVTAEAIPDFSRTITYRTKSVYRKLVSHRGHDAAFNLQCLLRGIRRLFASFAFITIASLDSMRVHFPQKKGLPCYLNPKSLKPFEINQGQTTFF